MLAELEVVVPGADAWRRVNFTLTPAVSTGCVDVPATADPLACDKDAGSACIRCGGEFVVGVSHGEILAGFVSLQPGSWARLPAASGGFLPVLRDGVEQLQAMGVTALRAGGTWAESGWGRWKEWRGPPWQRRSAGRSSSRAVDARCRQGELGRCEASQARQDQAGQLALTPALTTAPLFGHGRFI